MAAASASFTGSIFKSNHISINSAFFAGVRTVAFNTNIASHREFSFNGASVTHRICDGEGATCSNFSLEGDGEGTAGCELLRCYH
ncbi:hypothetical protein Hanom_Chr09g00819631 [Helianthus anomalus]